MNKKTNRTQIKGLAVAARELRGQEMAGVQGGGLNSSRSNPPVTERAVIFCRRCGKEADKDPCCPPPSLPN